MVDTRKLKSLLLATTLIASGGMSFGQERPADFLTQEFLKNWGLFTVGAHNAYASGFTGRGVTVAFADTPAQLTHPEFEGRVMSPLSYPQFGRPGFEIPYHGTHVMGITGAARDGRGMMGVAFDANLVALQGPTSVDGYGKSHEWGALSVQLGASVLNGSFSSSIAPSPVLSIGEPNAAYEIMPYLADYRNEVLNYVEQTQLLADADVLMVFATGNARSVQPLAADNPFFPALLPIITPEKTAQGDLYRILEDAANINDPGTWVFATDSVVINLDMSHLAGQLIAVTAMGEDEDGLFIPDFANFCGIAANWCLAGPGVLINSAYPIDTYEELTGTSMAAPHVAGVAALVREAFPYMTARQVIEVILTTATDFGLDPNLLGHGLVNAGRAVRGPVEFGHPSLLPDQDSIFAPVFAVDTAGHDSVWSNDISGTGGFRKSGAGRITLTGNNSYTGATEILGGVLQVDGSIAGSELTVADGAILQGRGTVGTTILSGVIAPGNSVGQLTVDGDLSLGASSVYDFEIGADLTGDLIDVTGNVVIDPQATFRVTTENGIDPSRTYTLLTAGGTVTGRFAGPAVPFTFLDLGTTASAGGVDLTASRNAVAMTDHAATLNQRAVARAIDTQTGGAQPRAIVLANTDPGALPALYQGFSGEIYSSQQAALLGETGAMGRILSKRIAATRGQGYQTGIRSFAATPADGSAAWTQGYGNWGKVDPSATAAAMTFSSQGLVLGLDRELENGFQLGAMLGFTDLKSRSAASQAKAKGYHLGLYGSGNFGAVVLGAGLLGSWYETEVDRTMPTAARPSASSKLSGNATQVFLEASLPSQAGTGFSFAPFAQLGQTWLHQEGFAEARSAAALTGRSSDASVGFAMLGARFERSWTANDTIWTVNASASWQRNWGDLAPTTTLSFDTGDPFSVSAAPVAEDMFALELGLSARIGGTVRADFGYTADLARKMDRHALTGSITWTF